MASAKLRVGVLIDGFRVPAWQRRALGAVAASDCSELALVVREAASTPLRPVWRRLRRLPVDAFLAMDRRLLARGARARDAVEVADLLGGLPSLRVRRRTDAPAELDSESVEALGRSGVDVLLHLGARSLTGAVCDALPLGVWTWSDLELQRRGFEPFLAELLEGRALWESSLIALRAGGGPPRALYRSWSSFEPSPFPGAPIISLERGRDAVSWKSASFAVRCLQGVTSGAAKAAPRPSEAPAPRRPGLRAAARLAATVPLRLFGRWRHRRFAGQWLIALRRPDGGSGFRELAAAPGRFIADPLLVAQGERHYLFYEDAPFGGNGSIHCAELDADGAPLRSRAVLEADGHLSYPFVFSWQDEWFMIPETSARRSVELYRAREFPWRWELERVLLQDVSATDATVWSEGGRLWLFTAMAQPGGSPNDELHLFFAETPFGPWTPHPWNPVVSDVRRARPAGPLFVENGALVRPAQDCSRHYGSAIWLQRIEALSETEYREVPLRRIGPEWCPGSLSTHTLSRAGRLEARDALRLVRR